MAQPYNGLETEEPAEVVPATKARQGSWGRHILWVLIISTSLAAIALLGSLAFHSNDLQGAGGQTKTNVGGQYDVPINTPRQTDQSPTG